MDEKILTVSQYLDLLNKNLKETRTKIIGEVFGIQEYPGRSYLYFSIKDKEDSSTMKCFMWKKDYSLSGVSLVEGMEVVISSYPSVYKPNGGLSLQVSSVELVGEGALKIAYEKLKSELQKEGLFDENKKREIPEFPKKIGVITSKQGAVINDFLSNIGKWGFEILFFDSKVEGDGAVKDIMDGLRVLYKEKVDCLVLMRGGGSFESFQAFNNENIVRAVCKFNAPVVTGIGHDKDIPLVCLVSDKNVSTPTAVANLLGQNYGKAFSEISLFEQKMLNIFESSIKDKIFEIEEGFSFMYSNLQNILLDFSKKINYFENLGQVFISKINKVGEKLNFDIKNIYIYFSNTFSAQKNNLENFSKILDSFNPTSRLKQGYSIIRKNGKILKTIKSLNSGDDLDLELSDGLIKTKVI